MRRVVQLLVLSLSVFALSPLARAADPAVERMFKAKCGACHGNDGKAQTKKGTEMKIADMTTAAWQKEFTDEKIKAAIENGVAREKDGAKQEMKPLKDKVTAEQIAQLTTFIRGLKK